MYSLKERNANYFVVFLVYTNSYLLYISYYVRANIQSVSLLLYMHNYVPKYVRTGIYQYCYRLRNRSNRHVEVIIAALYFNVVISYIILSSRVPGIITLFHDMVPRNQFVDGDLSDRTSLIHLLDNNDSEDNNEAHKIKHSLYYNESDFSKE